jgi:hypothetical protein
LVIRSVEIVRLSAPLADLLAIVLAEVEHLYAGALCGFTRPNYPGVDLDCVRQTVKRDEDPRDKIEFQCNRRGYQEAILTDVEKHALILLAGSNVDRSAGGNTRIEATLDGRIQNLNLCCGCGHGLFLSTSASMAGASEAK